MKKDVDRIKEVDKKNNPLYVDYFRKYAYSHYNSFVNSSVRSVVRNDTKTIRRD